MCEVDNPHFVSSLIDLEYSILIHFQLFWHTVMVGLSDHLFCNFLLVLISVNTNSEDFGFIFFNK